MARIPELLVTVKSRLLTNRTNFWNNSGFFVWSGNWNTLSCVWMVVTLPFCFLTFVLQSTIAHDFTILNTVWKTKTVNVSCHTVNLKERTVVCMECAHQCKGEWKVSPLILLVQGNKSGRVSIAGHVPAVSSKCSCWPDQLGRWDCNETIWYLVHNCQALLFSALFKRLPS